MDEFLKLVLVLSGTPIGGILGYLLKTQIDHRLAIARINESARITEFSKAAAAIRAAFAPSLAFIYLAKAHGSTHEIPNVDAFLRKALLEQAAAIEVFRPFVAESGQTIYQKAWEEYRYKVWNYGFDKTTFRDDVDDPEKVFEKLIHAILHFSELD